ncbi:diacylglycerol kinase [Celeribacter sp. PS-C1]|uniref:diacylglycerol kinase n=1 Tax=Celeribacter sp. PS-C1 TaxID=2820813 RepID=UPI001C66AAF7|nr:diacylglycerol kinase [Celeribacter sp. PS-C1]MBW6418403.1 diacylglycerol kinase [Celeribacter sp. PS-C1]
MRDKAIYTAKRLKRRMVWSAAGLCYAWRSEHSFRTWVWANLIAACLAFVLDLSALERALVIALGLLILAAELFNTAIEDAVDYISEREHPLAKSAKDAGSAAVTVTAIAAGVAWLAVLIG